MPQTKADGSPDLCVKDLDRGVVLDESGTKKPLKALGDLDDEIAMRNVATRQGASDVAGAGVRSARKGSRAASKVLCISFEHSAATGQRARVRLGSALRSNSNRAFGRMSLFNDFEGKHFGRKVLR